MNKTLQKIGNFLWGASLGFITGFVISFIGTFLWMYFYPGSPENFIGIGFSFLIFCIIPLTIIGGIINLVRKKNS